MNTDIQKIGSPKHGTKQVPIQPQGWNTITPAVKKEKSKDLFEHYTDQPPALKTICDKYAAADQTYSNCAEFLKEVEEIGYTFDYYLDAEPYNLHKMNEDELKMKLV